MFQCMSSLFNLYLIFFSNKSLQHYFYLIMHPNFFSKIFEKTSSVHIFWALMKPQKEKKKCCFAKKFNRLGTPAFCSQRHLTKWYSGDFEELLQYPRIKVAGNFQTTFMWHTKYGNKCRHHHASHPIPSPPAFKLSFDI